MSLYEHFIAVDNAFYNVLIWKVNKILTRSAKPSKCVYCEATYWETTVILILSINSIDFCKDSPRVEFLNCNCWVAHKNEGRSMAVEPPAQWITYSYYHRSQVSSFDRLCNIKLEQYLSTMSSLQSWITSSTHFPAGKKDSRLISFWHQPMLELQNPFFWSCCMSNGYITCLCLWNAQKLHCLKVEFSACAE